MPPVDIVTGMSDLSDEIQTAATSPAEMQNGDQRAKARPLSELIEADKYLAAKTAAAQSPRVLLSRLVPPGAK